MKRLMVAFAVISVSGCLCAKECEKNEDCASGQICGSQNLCETSGGGGSAGGTSAGGSAGGRAGGAGGGSSGGGMSAGGAAGGTAMGGGTVPTCSVACAEWQVCDTNFTPPICGDALLTVTAPVRDQAIETQGSLTVLAELRYDGGLVRTPIPVNAESLTPKTVPSGGAGTVDAPATAQWWTLRFGWDGGARADQRVEVRGCNAVTCADWQSCTGTVDGGFCADAVASLVWNGPDGGPYQPGVSLQAAVTVTMFDGGLFAAPVPLRGAASGTLVGSGNRKEATIVSPAADGPFTLIAGWDGGLLVSLTSRVDAVRPALTVTVEDAPVRLTQEVDGTNDVKRYRKDEVAKFRVEALEDVDFSGAVISPAVQVANGQCAACTNAARCQCYSLNLEPLTFNAMRGVQGLSVGNVRDVAGNVALPTDAGIQVTRFKWAAATPDMLGIRAAPALDSKGRLYVGTTDTNNNGNVYQIGLRGEVGLFAGGAAVQSIAVAESAVLGGREELVYIASNTAGGGNLRGHRLDGGFATGSGASGCFNSFGLAKTHAAVALFDAGVGSNGMEVGATGIFEPGGGTGTGGALCVYRAFSGPAQLTEASTSNWVVPNVPNPANSATNLVAVDNDVYLFQTNRLLRRFAWSSPSNLAFTDMGASAALATSGTPVSLAASPGRIFATIVGPAQPFVSTDRTGAQVSTFGNTSYSASGPVVLGPSNSASVPAPAIAYASTTLVTGDVLQKLLASLTQNISPQAVGVVNVAGTGAVEAAPVLGTPRGGQAGDALLYLMRRGGALEVFSVGADGSSTAGWSGSLFLTGTPSFFASPTLDCSRDASGAGRTGSGTFYAVASDGRIAAVIVDSPRLSTDAPWPKWQRTAGNAGNPGFPLNPGCP